MTQGPLPAYRARVAHGELAPDGAQEAAAVRLQALWEQLRGYDPAPPAPVARPGLLGRLFGAKPVAAPRPPKGLYLVGQVGRGKSMLMDLFFAEADVARRRRIHFHRFIQEAHARFHAHKREHPEIEDPIPPLADRIAAEAALLCFDEFQVHDIADAMILARLFEHLFRLGVVVVATSNTLPADLYKDGLQRAAFLPFIALLQEQLDLIVLEGGHDYRRDRIAGMRTWHVPADRRADTALDQAFADLTQGETPGPVTLLVMGRKFAVPLAGQGVARFDFQALCGAALGAGDYLALATHFPALVLDNVPALKPDNFDQAKRFITLVDALYEHRVKLIASAAAEPDALYREGENARSFKRTASRLMEMQAADYIAAPHLP